MSLLYLAGEKLNLLSRARSVVPSDADALFPIAGVNDDTTDLVFRFGSNGADRLITADLCFLVDPGLEAAGLPAWTDRSTGTGLTAAEAGIVNGGAQSLRCNGGVSGVGARTPQDIVVRSGERMTLDGFMRGDGAASARSRLQCLDTGNFLTPSLTWSATPQDLDTQSAASWAEKIRAFQVEPWLVCQRNLVTLRLTLQVTENGNGYFDDWILVPSVNFASLHGHNIDPLIAVQWRSSTDNFGGSDTLEATMAMKRPTFYSKLGAAVVRRYWRLKLSGTNTVTPQLGEWILGYAETAIRKQNAGWSLIPQGRQVRNATSGGRVYVTRLSQDTPRLLTLAYRHYSDAAMREVRDDIVQRTGEGKDPIVIVPYDVDDVVLHGRIGPEWMHTRDYASIWGSGLTVAESGFPGGSIG